MSIFQVIQDIMMLFGNDWIFHDWLRNITDEYRAYFLIQLRLDYIFEEK